MTADWLVVVAHPDDESLHCGALIAQAASRGERVVTLTLTRGENGRTLGMCSPAELPAVRGQELRAAARALGIHHVELRNLPDGRLSEAEEAGRQLVADALGRWRPRTVVGFPPNGFNGHPDHRAAHRILTAAVARSPLERPRTWLMTSGTPYTEDPRPGFLPPQEVESLRMPVTARVPVGKQLTAKLRAMGCHETQARSTAKILRLYPELLAEECFSVLRVSTHEQRSIS